MNGTPKNVRQVGNVDLSHKIYVEDYVITFTKSIGDLLAKDNCMACKAAVLLGRKSILHTEVETYISGMALIDSFSLSGEAAFSNETWSGIYDKIKEFYEDEEIVGWLYIGCGQAMQTDKLLINIHNSNFGGKNKIFMSYDYDEKEEAFYDYIDNTFVRRRGFYIYYQKNDTMHNYMLSVNEGQKVSPENEDRVVKDIRSILNQRQESQTSRKLTHSVYAAGMVVAAIALLVGTTAIYRFNDTAPVNAPVSTVSPVTSVETQIPMAETVAEGDVMEDEPVMNVTEVTETEVPATEVPVTETMTTEMPVTEVFVTEVPVTETVATEVPVTEIPATEAPAAETATSFYVVKKGDSLGSIAESIFSSVGYVDVIKEINGISDIDVIYEGQKLWIPDK